LFSVGLIRFNIFDFFEKNQQVFAGLKNNRCAV